MSFVANAAVRNQGRRGHFGAALQAEPGTFVPPTNFLRETGGTGFMPDELDRMSQAFRGTSFEAPAEYAGTDYQGRNVTTEATAGDAALILTALYGTPTAGGIITPTDATQWAEYYPLPAVDGEWYVPGAGTVKFLDGQIYEATFTVPEQRTEFATASLNFHAREAIFHPEGEAGFTPTTPVIPNYGGGLGRSDHSVTIGGTLYAADSTSTARFYSPVDPLPASGVYVGGFAPSEQPIGVEFQMSWGRPVPAMLAASKSKVFLPYVWRLASGGTQLNPAKLVEVTAQVQVSAREVPVAPGRVRTTATFRARTQTPGVSPFSIKIVNT